MQLKKIAHFAGKTLTILALILIVRRLFTMDVDYSTLLQKGNVLWIGILTVLYGLHIALLPYAWMVILEITTGHRLPFLIVQNIYCKSNLLKYIPGNIFQYVGRNEAAVRYALRHRDVALSTALDVIANIFGVFFVAVICYAAGFNVVFHTLEKYLSWKIILIMACIICVGAFIAYQKKELVLLQVKKILTQRNITKYAICVAYYMFFAVYSGLIYYFILTRLLHVQLPWGTAFVVVGAYLFSWLMGFLIPGAPGGIGVREAAIVALLTPYLDSDPVLLAILIYRIVNTVGDVVAYLGNRALLHSCNPESKQRA